MDAVEAPSAARKLAQDRGTLDDVIATLILDHCIAAEDVQAWCFAAIDEAVSEKTPAKQTCRDCGRAFPYDADADRCPSCIAAMEA